MGRYRKLVHRYKDRVYAFAFHYLGNQQDAEEVTQDVLVRLWEHYRKLDDDRLSSWLVRVTRNLCIDSYRRRRARNARLYTDSDIVESSGVRTSRLQPDDELDRSEQHRRIIRAVDDLPEPQRSIVHLREIHSMSYEEIGAALDLPLNTIKVYLHRARRALRERLVHEWQHEYE